MATTNDAFGLLPRPAQGMSKSRFVDIYNNYVKEDLRELVYGDFEDTYTDFFDFKLSYPSKPSAELGTGVGSIEQGKYRYRVSFVQTNGEGKAGEATDFVSVESSGEINLSGIDTGDDSTLSRKIYRQKNGSGAWQLVTTIADNTTTTYTDTTITTSLGERCLEGWELPSDYYEMLAVQCGDVELEEVKRIQSREYDYVYNGDDDNYGNYEYWVDRNDRDSGSSVSICFPRYIEKQNRTIRVMYFKDLPDMEEAGDLPFPTALQTKMRKIIPLGCAVWYLMLDLYGEDEHINKINMLYKAEINSLFAGYISTQK